MTIREWVAAANKLLKEDKSRSYQEAENILIAAGHSRPKGIKQNGSRSSGLRFALAPPKSPGQTKRRRNHVETSTPEADAHVAQSKLQRQQDRGIAEYAELPGMHGEHLVNQDSADAVRTGATGDLLQNIPADSGKTKTAAESIIRNDYNNEHVVGVGAENLRVIPKESFDELVSPDDLPGFDIDESKDLPSQLKRLAKNGNGNGNGNGATKLIVDESRNVLKVANKGNFDSILKLAKALI